MAAYQKRIHARVSLPDGQFLKVWEDFQFRGFSKELNGGLSECVLTIGRAFDYDENDVAEGNDVQLIVADRDTTDDDGDHDGMGARIIYRGYISLIERSIAGNAESITVHLLGYYTRLSLDVLKNGSQTTLYSNSTTGLTTTLGSQDAADIGDMASAVIDRYRTEASDTSIYYTADDIPDTSTTATFSFSQKTYRDAIDDLKALAPEGTYWYVDETGRFSFKPTPTTATHTFVFGKHFLDVNVQRSLEKVRNVLLLWNGKTGGSSIYKHYEDTASIALYGRRTTTSNAFGVDNSNAADLIGTKFLAENKDPETKITCTIIDNNGDASRGYDIESVQPGDTCRFVGFSSGLSDVFRDNMLITSVDYSLDQIRIEVEIIKSTLVDFQGQNARKIADINSGGFQITESYT